MREITPWDDSTELDDESPGKSPLWVITAVETTSRSSRKKLVSRAIRQNGVLDTLLNQELNDTQPLKTKWIAKLLFDEV